MKRLASNHDLYLYLSSLSSALKGRGQKAMSDTLDFAIGHGSSSSTEFLGESRIALRRILNAESDALTGEELVTLADVLKQLDEALHGQ